MPRQKQQHALEVFARGRVPLPFLESEALRVHDEHFPALQVAFTARLITLCLLCFSWLVVHCS